MQISVEGSQLLLKFYQTPKNFAGNPQIEVRRIDKNHLQKYAADFCRIYNAAKTKQDGNKDETPGWFTYYQGKPVAIRIDMPGLNQLFNHFNGKLTNSCYLFDKEKSFIRHPLIS